MKLIFKVLLQQSYTSKNVIRPLFHAQYIFKQPEKVLLTSKYNIFVCELMEHYMFHHTLHFVIKHAKMFAVRLNHILYMNSMHPNYKYNSLDNRPDYMIFLQRYGHIFYRYILAILYKISISSVYLHFHNLRCMVTIHPMQKVYNLHLSKDKNINYYRPMARSKVMKTLSKTSHHLSHETYIE